MLCDVTCSRYLSQDTVHKKIWTGNLDSVISNLAI